MPRVVDVYVPEDGSTLFQDGSTTLLQVETADIDPRAMIRLERSLEAASARRLLESLLDIRQTLVVETSHDIRAAVAEIDDILGLTPGVDVE